MPDVVIKPSRRVNEAAISGPVLFFVNPGDVAPIASAAKRLKAIRHPLFYSNLFEIPGQTSIWWAGPALGSPAAVMVLEKLIACGATKIIVHGCCGSLGEALRAGEIFMPVSAFSEEGTSSHYPLSHSIAPHEELHQQVVKQLSANGYPVKEGAVWTTDAPYRETRAKILAYNGQGIMAVDMEFSALAAVAAFRNVRLASVMLVSDELYHQSWRPLFQTKGFKRKSKEIFLLLSRIACNLI
ncbi:MAG: nucleoside phosphorylase [Deltaproteobacteria bacterium]|nr:nucleoside phosphorylase [Deltaproteobacteria bacterium]